MEARQRPYDKCADEKEMKIENSLCVLIPLMGREKETHRILNYFNKVNLPFKILLADGGTRDLSGHLDTGNLNLEYFYNGPDRNIHDFMRKMHIAFNKIKSPLTIMVDNDDFISVSGMIDGIKYLAENNQFSSYRQNVMSQDNSQPIYKSTSIIDDNLFDRVFCAMENRTVSWHDITRTAYNKMLFRILDHCNVNDLQMAFSSNMFWSEIYGKSYKGFDKNYYYHISGNSLVQNKGIYAKYNNWMSDQKFDTSFCILLSAASHAICFQSKQSDLNIYDTKKILGEFYLQDLAQKNNISRSKLNLAGYIEESNKYDSICKDAVTSNDCDAPLSFNITNTYTDIIGVDEELNIVKELT